jgi:hypothetical protein
MATDDGAAARGQVGRNITQAHPTPWALPPLFFCVHDQCVPSGNRTGVPIAAGH